MKCFQCQRMISKTKIQLHMLNVHSYRIIQSFDYHETCPVCYSVILKKNFTRHIRNMHPGYNNKPTFESNVLNNKKRDADDLALEENLLIDESSMVDNLMDSNQRLGNINVNVMEKESIEHRTFSSNELCVLDRNYVRCKECNLVMLRKNLSRHKQNIHSTNQIRYFFMFFYNNTWF